MIDRIAASISSTTLVASPVAAEVVARWIGDGTADRVMEWKRSEVRARQTIASDILGGAGYRAHRASPHGWLKIPEPWSVRDLVEQARMRGVLVSPAEDFIAARSTEAHAVRICLGPVDERSQLKTALSTLADILTAPPEPCHALI
jgi:DNA-binding transcriptional MocR family regulator